jgi:hypothetical protein
MARAVEALQWQQHQRGVTPGFEPASILEARSFDASAPDRRASIPRALDELIARHGIEGAIVPDPYPRPQPIKFGKGHPLDGVIVHQVSDVLARVRSPTSLAFDQVDEELLEVRGSGACGDRNRVQLDHLTAGPPSSRRPRPQPF